MSSINLKVLKQAPTQVQTIGDKPAVPTIPFTYSDLQLDLSVGNSVGNFPVGKDLDLTDIKVSYDYAAIKNSIENIFNSVPGQWILNPPFGIGLPQFLFFPVDQFTGQKIADAILQNLTTYEPRVKIQNLQIVGDPDNNAYSITLVIQLINVNNNSRTLTGTLNSSSFQFTS